MIDHFAEAYRRALAHEISAHRDYSNDANDRGGETRFGVTEKAARR